MLAAIVYHVWYRVTWFKRLSNKYVPSLDTTMDMMECSSWNLYRGVGWHGWVYQHTHSAQIPRLHQSHLPVASHKGVTLGSWKLYDRTRWCESAAMASLVSGCVAMACTRTPSHECRTAPSVDCRGGGTVSPHITYVRACMHKLKVLLSPFCYTLTHS